MGVALSGQQADQRRRNALVARQQGLALLQFFCLNTDILAVSYSPLALSVANDFALGIKHNVFLHDDRRGTRRNRRTGKNARRLPWLQTLRGFIAGGDTLHDFPTVAIVAVNGVTVHGAVVESGHIVLHQNVLCQHALIQLHKRHGFFRSQWLVGFQQGFQSNVVIKQIRHLGKNLFSLDKRPKFSLPGFAVFAGR